MKAYQKGAMPMLSYEKEKESYIQNNKFKDDHPFKFKALEEIQKKPVEICFSARDILEASGLREASKATKEDYKQMGFVLKELGCKKGKRRNGSRTWYRPEGWSLNDVQ